MPLSANSKIYVAGHKGLVGDALVRHLQQAGYSNLVLRSSKELDLRDSTGVQHFFNTEKPKFVFLAAAKVGGILANNTYRAEFIYDNLMIATNVIHAAWQHQVEKLLFLGSSCIYPKNAPQPLKESYLLSGPLEPTNQPYAMAKIAGIELCQAYRSQYGCHFISAMPTNLYGSNDNFDLETSHVLPALIRKCHEAKLSKAETVTIWGSGSPKREFLHVDDLAEACLFLMQHYDEAEPINVGTGQDIEIRELVQLIADVVGFKGKLIFDPTKPDGTPRKVLDISRIQALGWQAKIELINGIQQTYKAYTAHLNESLQVSG